MAASNLLLQGDRLLIDFDLGIGWQIAQRHSNVVA